MTVLSVQMPVVAQQEPVAAQSLFTQAIAWGLAIAVAVLILSAAGWAIASTRQHPGAATQAKTGIIVALVGALLLGSARGYLAWLNTSQAAAFAADPASYAVDTRAPLPGFEIINKTTAWTRTANQIRADSGLNAIDQGRALERLATSCATSLAGGQGICPGDGQYYVTKLAPNQLVMLSDPLTGDVIGTIAPNLLVDQSELFDDIRVAFVAVRNTGNGTAAVVVIESAGPCPTPCTPDRQGEYLPGLLTHVS